LVFIDESHGRGAGVGRPRGSGVALAVAVGVGVPGVAVTVGVAVKVGIGVAVAVGVGVNVAVDVGLAVTVGVDVGVGPSQNPWSASIRQPSPEPPLSLPIRHRNAMVCPEGSPSCVVINPPELPVHAGRPVSGLPQQVLIVPLYPP
jgi:hypothetical protein